MAYMCADSGNLMAIAQQVIQQKQQQLRQHQDIPAAGAVLYSPPWAATATNQHHSATMADFHPFAGVADASFPGDPFAAATVGGCNDSTAAGSVHLGFDGGDFDSEEWMESLIVGNDDSPMESIFPETSLNPATTESRTPAALLQPLDPPDRTKVSDHGGDGGSRNKPDADRKQPPSTLFASLLECSRIADSDPDLAAKSLIRIRESVSDNGDATERTAFYFANALYRRISASGGDSGGGKASSSSPEELTLCYRSLNDACPYTKFAHLTANQAILEATASSSRIHIVDFGIAQGVQWAALLQALATRSAGGGKPSRVRISGVPAPDMSPSALAATGIRLREFAALLDLNFDFNPVTAGGELTGTSFSVEPEEAVAVNFMMQLGRMLGEEADRALRLARSLDPAVVTVGEYEFTGGGGEERFGSALEFYSAMFGSVEAAMGRESPERGLVERELLRRRIEAAVVTEEVRMEGMEGWRSAIEASGMRSFPASNYAVSQAKLLLWNHYDYSSRYSVAESKQPGFLSIAWDGRPILSVSSWR